MLVATGGFEHEFPIGGAATRQIHKGDRAITVEHLPSFDEITAEAFDRFGMRLAPARTRRLQNRLWRGAAIVGMAGNLQVLLSPPQTVGIANDRAWHVYVR